MTLLREKLGVSSVFTAMEIELFPQPLMGIVEMAIAPDQRGRVKCNGSYWPARFYRSDCQVQLQPDERVTVVAREGITMLVVPCQ